MAGVVGCLRSRTEGAEERFSQLPLDLLVLTLPKGNAADAGIGKSRRSIRVLGFLDTLEK